MNPRSRVYVAGGQTLLGAAMVERLQAGGYTNLVGVGSDEPDLRAAWQVDDFFEEMQPEYVFFAAGKSGGIGLNRTRPAELMLDNLLATTHVLDASHRFGVRKLLYLASACAYPREAPQPLAVESLLTGAPEATSRPYAMAKLAGWQLCDAYWRQHNCNFVTAIPTNAFGPHDDFGPQSGHVIPALMRRTHEAHVRGERELVVWGSGMPRREFIYSRDLADACIFAMRHCDAPEPINLGGGPTLSIAETAQAVANVVGYRGRLTFDPSKPDGAPLKALDCGPLRLLGWRPGTDFAAALAETYEWFLRQDAKKAAA